MQARAMALLEFGCPPLPVANGERLETGEAAIINSHDLLSVFMVQAFKQQDSGLNRARKEQQSAVEHAYYEELTGCKDSLESIYNVMATYTKAYLATYLLPPFSIHDIRILSIDHTPPALSRQIGEYTHGLRVLYDLPPQPATSNTRSRIRECRDILLLKKTSELIFKEKDK